MRKQILFSFLAAIVPVSMMAQDDLYFTPKKQSKVVSTVEELKKEEPTYYSGSDRDVDEYNRRGKLSSYYQKIGEDSLGNDIIVFHAGDGSYDISKADTVYRGSGSYYDDSDDYAYSRRMSRFDGWYDPWFYGHSYYPWYDSWYDPWYYGYGWGWRWRYGWYDPWYYGYYGYYGWGYPYYHYGWGYPRYYAYGGRTGTYRHRFPSHGVTGSRSTGYSRNGRTRTFDNRSRNYGNNNRNWNNNSTWNSTPSRSNGSMGSFGGGSFGGSRGGGFGGGSRSGGGGGGHFGGRR